MLLQILKSDFPLDVAHHHRIRHLCLEPFQKLELRISLREIPHQLQGMEDGMVLGPRLEHYLIAPAEFTLIASRGRCESARTHQNTLRDRKHLQLAVSDEWCSEIFIGPCSADGRGDGRVVPKTAPAVHPAGEHPRNVRSRSNGPWQ